MRRDRHFGHRRETLTGRSGRYSSIIRATDFCLASAAAISVATFVEMALDRRVSPCAAVAGNSEQLSAGLFQQCDFVLESGEQFAELLQFAGEVPHGLPNISEKRISVVNMTDVNFVNCPREASQ